MEWLELHDLRALDLIREAEASHHRRSSPRGQRATIFVRRRRNTGL
ncbi:hypothetical protein [Georgenia yuyongxinii]|nr:hypothetical protein [Georgenia yuyongxinii]